MPALNNACDITKTQAKTSSCSWHAAPHGSRGPFLKWGGAGRWAIQEPRAREYRRPGIDGIASSIWARNYPTWQERTQALNATVRLLKAHQGRGNVWYGGVIAVTTRWHEGSLASGLIVARTLGIITPFLRFFLPSWFEATFYPNRIGILTTKGANDYFQAEQHWPADDLPRVPGSGPSAAKACAAAFLPHTLDLTSRAHLSELPVRIITIVFFPRFLSSNNLTIIFFY
jgi:hypothetical protein